MGRAGRAGVGPAERRGSKPLGARAAARSEKPDPEPIRLEL